MINELNSRNCEKTKRIPEIKIGEQVVTSSGEIAEIFNSYFSNIGADLAAEIPASEYKPEDYLIPTDKTFSLEIPTIDTVHRLLKTIDEKKSPGLDKIPNKLLKTVADVIAPSLTKFLRNLFILEYFQANGKNQEYHQHIRMVRSESRVIIDRYL